MKKNTTALIVNQWLQEWDGSRFEPVPPRGKPQPSFYLFRMNAYDLKRLSGVYRRDPTRPPAEDINIQRRHDEHRSAEILRYLQDGFPLSRIDRRKLVDPSEADDLRMPGWVPTAIVANILVSGDGRGPKNVKIKDEDLILVSHRDDGFAELTLPAGLDTPGWSPPVHPIEIIDGQHRLWALEEDQLPLFEDEFRKQLRSFDLPVVAFHGLDRTWQAYLFYTINQLPKKIDQSLVFDLYPLLRNEDWLLRFEGPRIYRDSRAQDLTIILWSHPASPWKDRIERLGGRTRGKVTQASFIRSLTATLIKTYRTEGKRVGGLFGSPRGTHNEVLNWSREQQAAFLIVAWQLMEEAVRESEAIWANSLRARASWTPTESAPSSLKDPAFFGTETLLATDQGVRGFLSVLNDILVVAYDRGIIELDTWQWSRSADLETDHDAVSDAIRSLGDELPNTLEYVRLICGGIADLDWRLSKAIDQEQEKDAFNQASAYRGSGGYRLLRNNLTRQIQSRHPSISEVAELLIDTQEDEEI